MAEVQGHFVVLKPVAPDGSTPYNCAHVIPVQEKILKK